MLINLRNALMTGKRLPYDAEVEYLESTGTQWIDTLVNADSNLSVEITMANAGTPWTNVNPMGAILATPRYRHHLNFNNNTAYNGINYYLGAGDMCVAASGYKPADSEIFTFKVDAISKTFTLGSFLGTFPNDTFDTGLSYWLFGRNGTTPPQLGSLRIYSCKIWDNGVLVRDYIPVRKGTVGYLYDRVSGALFGNAGTGNFVLGQDVVPVEYIESHGTEWIDTGVYGSDAVKATLDLQLISLGRARGIFGAYSSTSSSLYVYQTGGSSGVWQVGFGRYGNTAKRTDTERHNIEFNDFHVDIDGETIATFSQIQFTTSHTMTIFTTRNESGGVYDSTGSRCYGSKIWQSNIPVRKFLPVRVGTDATSWEGAMMDTLTRRIYRNAGTGAFTYGNDLKYPIPAA